MKNVYCDICGEKTEKGWEIPAPIQTVEVKDMCEGCKLAFDKRMAPIQIKVMKDLQALAKEIIEIMYAEAPDSPADEPLYCPDGPPCPEGCDNCSDVVVQPGLAEEAREGK